MANVDDVSKLKVDQLKELAAQHDVELADGDKKDVIVLKVADGITSEQLEAYNNKSNDESAKGSTEAEDSADDNDGTAPEDETTPAEQAEKDIEKSGVQNSGISGTTVNEDAGEGEPDAKSDGANDEDQTVAPQPDGVDGVDRDHTPNEDHPEEAAAARAGVQPERLDDPKQNREPKNDFEAENQKVTEVERQAAQEVSDMTTQERVETAPTPAQTGASDAESTAATIAKAIADGLKDIKDEKFELQEEPGIDHRFSVVRSRQTGEVMIRENATGHLSKIQLESLEEKEASIQDTEVDEI